MFNRPGKLQTGEVVVAYVELALIKNQLLRHVY